MFIGRKGPRLKCWQFQVLDPDFGWSGFREHYSSSTWQWLTAATKARSENESPNPTYIEAIVCSPNSITLNRFMLLSASMSETALTKVAGKYTCFPCDTMMMMTQINTKWHHDDPDKYKVFFLSGTLGVDRRHIRTFFKDPSRLNVFQQIRTVDRISSRFQNTQHLLNPTILISATLTKAAVFCWSLPCLGRKSRFSADLQTLSGVLVGFRT